MAQKATLGGIPMAKADPQPNKMPAGILTETVTPTFGPETLFCLMHEMSSDTFYLKLIRCGCHSSMHGSAFSRAVLKALSCDRTAGCLRISELCMRHLMS